MSYNKCFGTSYGSILTEAQSRSIKFGNALQDLLVNMLRAMGLLMYTDKELQELGLTDKSCTPDFVIKKDGKIFVFELKSHANHDSGKKQSIGRTLVMAAKTLEDEWSTPIEMCYICFYETNPVKIYQDADKKVPMEHCLTGEQFMNMTGMDKSTVHNALDEIKKSNILWLKSSLATLEN